MTRDFALGGCLNGMCRSMQVEQRVASGSNSNDRLAVFYSFIQDNSFAYNGIIFQLYYIKVLYKPQ